MEELLQLINIVKNKGQRSLQLVNQNFRKKEKSKDNILFNGLVNNEFATENEVAKKLFKTDPGNRNFRNTKAKLKRRLLNNLYFLDYNKSEYTAYQKAYYECLSQLHQIKILIMEGANCIATKRIPTLIKTAIDYELYEIALDALLLKRNEFSKLGKCTPLNISESDIKAIRPIIAAINESEDIFYDMLVLINKSSSSCEKVLDDIPRKIKKIEGLSKKHMLRRLDVLAHKLKIYYHSANQDHKGILKECSILETKYVDKGYENIQVNMNYKELVFLKLNSFYVLNKNEEGIEYANNIESIFRPGNADWFKFKEFQFLLLMKAEKFHQATKVFRMIRTNKNYVKIADIDKERWQIYRVYLLFVNDSKLIKWGFDIEKFKSYTPDFDKEHQGFNIATLIIQFLFYFREADIKNFKLKLDRLSRLSSIHLDKRHNYRNSIFIRMLEIVADKDYNYELILEKGSTYYKKLITSQIPPDWNLELEIIPFEKLWEYILNILKTNKYYLHYRFYHLHEA